MITEILTHVIPVGDTEIHVADEACWCHPLQDPEEPRQRIHNAADAREATERVMGGTCSKGWVLIYQYSKS